MELIVKKVANEKELEEIFALREKVFVGEQGVPINIERDDADSEAVHILAKNEDKVIACARLVIIDDYAKLGRLAVDREFRRKGVGSEVCKAIINIAREMRLKKIILHAQYHSKEFYFKLGFQAIGDVFFEAGIKHIKMFQYLSDDKKNIKSKEEEATLAGGCFWCLEAAFKELHGIKEVRSAYSGGEVSNPSYEEVCTGKTGHAEVVRIKFDPSVINYRDLLKVFFSLHDPTTLNRQGEDVGTQYRSAIFYHNQQQKEIAQEVIEELEETQVFDNPIVTELSKLGNFYPAEDYHKDYYKRNPEKAYCSIVIAPKLAKFRKKYKKRINK
ncbi:peptide-methionine (S)-S-oxide reductase MsrA [Natronospora cellulosivora (SeqCode)]